jgi:hypothetical protein
MKRFCCFVAVAVCLGLTGIAHANQINFSANILDPPGGTLETTNSFAVTFDPCSAFTAYVGGPYDGPPGLANTAVCFEAENATGIVNPAETWTSVTITIDDPGDYLGLNDATCGTLDGPGLFSTSNCSEVGDVYTLSFSGTAQISTGQSFFIAVAAPNVAQSDLLADFDNTTDSAVAGVVPEPNSLVLLSTGTLMFGMLAYTQRRRLGGSSARS